MVLPEFNEIGYLPRGIHRCQMDEVLERFGAGSEEREIEAAALADFTSWARAAGVARLIVDGSFVTDKVSPLDVDVAILPGPGYPRKELPAESRDSRWPFLDIKIAKDEDDLAQWAQLDFGLDRRLIPRGVVEIEL